MSFLPGTEAYRQLSEALEEVERLRTENQVLSRFVGAAASEPPGLRDDLYYEGDEPIIERLIEAVVELRAWTRWRYPS